MNRHEPLLTCYPPEKHPDVLWMARCKRMNKNAHIDSNFKIWRSERKDYMESNRAPRESVAGRTARLRAWEPIIT